MERATISLMLHSSYFIHQHILAAFYFRSIRDWNTLPPGLIDHDKIDQFTNEVQQIYSPNFCMHVTMSVIAYFFFIFLS